MTTALAFALEAPLASWGAGLSGTVRTTDSIPTHSALLGLIGAALGLSRGDERLAKLAADYASAVWVVRGGERMTDYHTVETPMEKGFVISRARTRSDELAGTTATTITRREYLMDVRHIVALVPLVTDPVYAPNELMNALQEPVFTLSAGRRSCSLSGPVVPVEVDGDDLGHFLSLATVWDTRIGSTEQGHSIRRRTDLLLSATKRRFAAREEVVR